MKPSTNCVTSKSGLSFPTEAAGSFLLTSNKATKHNKSQKAASDRQQLLHSAGKEKQLKNEEKCEWRKKEDQIMYHQEQQEELAGGTSR